MNRIYNYDADVTPPSVTVDLSPPFEEMELLYPEIEVFQGDSATINFAITQGGQPFDLTGYTVRFVGKRAIGDPSPVFSRTASVPNPSGGQCSVALSPSDLAQAGTFQSQLYLTLPGATVTALQIPLTVNPSV